MGDPNGKLSSSGTQIDDLPSCLIIDILLRLPIKSLVVSTLVCKSWFLLSSDPLFAELHRARSPTSYLFCQNSGLKKKFCCTDKVRGISGENVDFGTNVTLPNFQFTCVNSCHGLLCLEKYKCRWDKIYVCNPILGEYVTIRIDDNKYIYWSVLGFCSRSNQFKVLQISRYVGHDYNPCVADIYTIGNGTRRWRCIGVVPWYTTFVNAPANTFLNGSIHWMDRTSRNICYFNFESEKFGSLPLPPAWGDRIFPMSHLVLGRVGVVDGRLCIYAGVERCVMELWMMKEYGVEESWTLLSSMITSKLDHRYHGERARLSCVDYRLIVRGCPGVIYNPSFISLQDVAKGEKLTLLSIARTPWERLWGLRSRLLGSVLKCFCLESWM